MNFDEIMHFWGFLFIFCVFINFSVFLYISLHFFVFSPHFYFFLFTIFVFFSHFFFLHFFSCFFFSPVCADWWRFNMIEICGWIIYLISFFSFFSSESIISSCFFTLPSFTNERFFSPSISNRCLLKDKEITKGK